MKITPLPARIEKIKALLETQATKKYYQYFRGEEHELGRYTVALDFPLYRLANGRTQALQEEYIFKNKKQPTFFSDPENIEAQKAQDSILRNLIEQEGLEGLFEGGEEQSEPILLDRQGFVINGNRRLCTWRKLFEADPVKYKHFEYVSVAFLPQCDQKDVIFLEAELQMQKEVKAKYSWTGRAFLIRSTRKKLGLSDNELARKFGLKSAKEVQDTIDRLELADIYLKSRGKEKFYSELDDKTEFAFIQMQKTMPKNPSAQRFFKDAVFDLIDQVIAGNKKGRTYADIKVISKQINGITDRFNSYAKKQGLIQPAQPDTAPSKGIAALIGNSKPAEADAYKLLSNPEAKQLFLTIVADAIDTNNEADSAEKNKNSSAIHLQAAIASVDQAIDCLKFDPDKAALRNLLQNIDSGLDKLKKWSEKDG